MTTCSHQSGEVYLPSGSDLELCHPFQHVGATVMVRSHNTVTLTIRCNYLSQVMQIRVMIVV